MYDYLIVGAGISGISLAERLANDAGYSVMLIDKRDHIGGNCYDYFDSHNILVHKYGPHILHTNSLEVKRYLSLFTLWIPYKHKVKSNYRNKLYTFPINGDTINQFYDQNLKTRSKVKEFLSVSISSSKQECNSEEYLLNRMPKDLYEAFYKYYSYKQWGRYPSELPKSICSRIPIKLNNNNYYFTDKYQMMPAEGFTQMFKKMLSNKKIEMVLNTDYAKILGSIKFNKLIYTGKIDEYFDFMYGELFYRSLKMQFKNIDIEYFQETAVINYPELKPKYTRISEYKYITGQKSNSTTISYEYPSDKGEACYPLRNEVNLEHLNKYKKLAQKYQNVIFAGRLGEYKYYNIDQAVCNSLRIYEKSINKK
ncbi:MAG: UDP-galactopyranose mutase [Melioribacteraceae bacterium]|nr:UDP-galactopyranose mutase [Melioribacteraceae bacterium]